MKIKEVFCNKNNTIMNVKEVAEHEDHHTIKHALKCATPDCEAKISFVSGSGGRHDHFRKVRYEEHSPNCHIQNTEKELKERIEVTEKIAVSLDKKAIEQRVMYFFKKRTEPGNKESTGNSSTTKRNNESTNTVPGQATVLGDDGDPSLEDEKKKQRTSSPRVLPRLLNQISSADEGKYIQLSASIERVRKTKKGFEIDLYLGKSKAVLVLTESFFKGSGDEQIPEYLTSLMKFTDIKEESNFEVSVYVFCMFHSYKKNETIIFADNFDRFYLSISGKHSKPIKLDSFQAGFIRGNWKK